MNKTYPRGRGANPPRDDSWLRSRTCDGSLVLERVLHRAFGASRGDERRRRLLAWGGAATCPGSSRADAKRVARYRRRARRKRSSARSPLVSSAPAFAIGSDGASSEGGTGPPDGGTEPSEGVAELVVAVGVGAAGRGD